ncbi:MAG: hypothetical protein HXS48_09155 [Theionarchaea archaeon]|nr:hypothetical protein [Theionarchaea archaeon]
MSDKSKKVKLKVELFDGFEKRNLYDSSLHYFLNNLKILSTLNKVLPSSIDAYCDQEFKKLKIQQMSFDEDDQREWDKYLNFVQRTIEGSTKMKSFQTENAKVAKIIYNGVDIFMYKSRFKMFVREMSLVYLITCFEELLQSTLKITFTTCPDTLKSSQKTLTYEEILKQKEISDMLECLIEKETTSVIHEDIDGINKYLKRNFGLDLALANGWHLFRERFYRRNIVVHNNCYPNRIYRQKAKYRGKDVRLSISRQYLSRSYKLFQKFGEQIHKYFIEKFAGTAF